MALGPEAWGSALRLKPLPWGHPSFSGKVVAICTWVFEPARFLPVESWSVSLVSFYLLLSLSSLRWWGFCWCNDLRKDSHASAQYVLGSFCLGRTPLHRAFLGDSIPVSGSSEVVEDFPESHLYSLQRALCVTAYADLLFMLRHWQKLLRPHLGTISRACFYWHWLSDLGIIYNLDMLRIFQIEMKKPGCTFSTLLGNLC